MTFSKQHFLPLLLFFFFLPLLSASEPKRCYSSSCAGNSFDVTFPFWLFPNHSSSCGYPGFNLYCTDRHETALNLLNSGPFLVQEIKSQRIRLNDPDNCLARRLLSFDASQSPFSPLHLLNYTFLICPNQDVKSSSFKPIHCLGNSTTSFFATPLELVGSMPPSCQVFKTLLIPVSSPFAVDLNDQDLWLKWDSPDCTNCVDFTPLCGFINNTTLQVKCFAYVDSGTNPVSSLFSKLHIPQAETINFFLHQQHIEDVNRH